MMTHEEARKAIVADFESGALSIINGWVAHFVDKCTCYGGGPYGHEPGCGSEPIFDLASDLAETWVEHESQDAGTP